MRINHNIAALNTYRQLTANNTAVGKSLEKLSSGLRINRAGDDAAGLAISEKMRGQIRGLDMASKNSQDAISLIQTAEGALTETHAILQRMRELAVQAASDTNTDQDRANLQDELDQLISEIDRIGNTTQFNTKNLLDGSLGAAVTAAVKSEHTNKALKEGTNSIALTTLLTALTDSAGKSLGIVSGDRITISYFKNGELVTNTITVSDTSTLNDLTISDVTITVNSSGELVATAATGGFANAVNGLTLTVKDSNGNIKTPVSSALSSFVETRAAADLQAEGRATFHIGANTDQNIQLAISDMRALALGVNGLKISEREQANVAIKVIDAATQKVSAQRSALGAVQNRLEHTINNLGAASENLSAAESRIRDVDMAKEMMEYTKNSILTQAAQAMLAQANQQPQGVLQLLR